MRDGDKSILRPLHPVARPLSTLVAEFGLEARGSLDGVEVTGITLDSRTVLPGDVFVGLQGANRHGAGLAEDARERGAVAILTDAAGAAIAQDAGLPIVVVESPREALGDIAAWVYRTAEDPPLLLAITGTNGKTSVSYLLHGILTQLGLVSGVSTTVMRAIGAETVASNLTTPEATDIHGLLARMRESEVRAVTLEVSAQALTHRRVDGVTFDVAGFLNLSRDHLDEYPSMEEYFRAKALLFSDHQSRRAVVSIDTPWGVRIVDGCHIPVTTLTAEGVAGADWTMTILDEQVEYTEFELSGPGGRSITTRIPVIGHYMAANAALAIVMLVEAGFDLDAIGHALNRDGGIQVRVPGRVELVSGSSGPTVIVDYAHSPDAFRVTLAAVRRVARERIIMVTGADGDRDTGKREEMGRFASEGSDILIVTDLHPRSEVPASIRAALLAGAAQANDPAETHDVASPRDAIRLAISLARDGDIILWAGPGHEDYFEIDGEKLPFDGREEARIALREAGWS